MGNQMANLALLVIFHLVRRGGLTLIWRPGWSYGRNATEPKSLLEGIIHLAITTSKFDRETSQVDLIITLKNLLEHWFLLG
jgi:hypothetical protein